ncbi:MAG: DUF4149 domain-containing protein [Chloracidobacterium sp.]|nr:DUF4149 domain-containing protein [Chloracidobacterium sp.]MCC6825738.1 DUF4149 domain-containing protein [Acidobacteriota bacterium]MCO5332891.1 DUF4149 domain-containing protein [Pyrinomonadaceae bacterium]
MKFLSDIRLLLLGVWLGSAVFFIGVAQTAFALVADRGLAGAVVGRSLSILNYGGLIIAVLLILTSLMIRNASAFWLWTERLLLLIVGAACAVGEFVIGLWMSSIRSQFGGSIDQAAADDPLKIRFDQLHHWSEWVLTAAMIAAFIAFFIIANRKFTTPKAATNIYDFEKEFKI